MSLGALLLAAAGSAALPAEPLDYRARSISLEPKAHRILLDGDVRLQRDSLVVTGDRARADLAPAAPPPVKARGRRGRAATAEVPALSGQELRRFTVDGNVHVDRAGRTADGGHAEFDAEAQTLVLTGGSGTEAAPILRDGGESLSGERIVLFVDRDDVDVLRPRVVLRRGEEPGEARAVPVRVEAMRLRLDSERRLAHFSDDVVVHRGDVVVRGPRLDARYRQGGELAQLDLRGGVELNQGDRRATGETATYDAATRKVVLLGEPKLYDRGDVLAGDRIEMALDSHEVRVDRAHGRLRPDVHRGEEEGR